VFIKKKRKKKHPTKTKNSPTKLLVAGKPKFANVKIINETEKNS